MYIYTRCMENSETSGACNNFPGATRHLFFSTHKELRESNGPTSSHGELRPYTCATQDATRRNRVVTGR